jgi:type II secretory pathway predicted ATPase ExeA
MNAETSQKPHILHALKTVLGAACMPFGAAANEPCASGSYLTISQKLEQLCAVKASGILHGPHGVGKSYLIGRFIKALPEKAYKAILLTHTTMSGSDLIRGICHKLAIQAQMWRSSNVRAIIEEAQNLNAAALEELRLLTCSRPDSGPLFSLLLAGDESLLARLQLGVNRPLLSRIGYSLQLHPMTVPESRHYIQSRLREAAIHVPLFEPAAEEIIIQASQGVPRQINHLAQRAIENALSEGLGSVSTLHVQTALESLPWLTRRPT